MVVRSAVVHSYATNVALQKLQLAFELTSYVLTFHVVRTTVCFNLSWVVTVRITLAITTLMPIRFKTTAAAFVLTLFNNSINFRPHGVHGRCWSLLEEPRTWITSPFLRTHLRIFCSLFAAAGPSRLGRAELVKREQSFMSLLAGRREISKIYMQ